MSELIEFVEHVITNPDVKFANNKFRIDENQIEYGDTQRKQKEHKLWTPRRDGYRCFLILKSNKTTLEVQNLFENDELKNILENKEYFSHLTFSESETIKTVADKKYGEGQFVGSVEVELKAMSSTQIAELMTDITRETVSRDLHQRQK